MSDQPQTELGELLLELIIEGAKYGYNNNSNGLSSTLTEAQKRYANDLIAQGIALITQAKKDLLAEVREKSENLSEVESTTPNTYNFRPIEAVPLAAINEIEEGLTQDTKGGTDDTPRV